jgi:hypothetical protein
VVVDLENQTSALPTLSQIWICSDLKLFSSVEPDPIISVAELDQIISAADPEPNIDQDPKYFLIRLYLRK